MLIPPRLGRWELAGGDSHRILIEVHLSPGRGAGNRRHAIDPPLPSFHVVFSTKNREPRIDAEWRDRLHAFVGGVARTSQSMP